MTNPNMAIKDAFIAAVLSGDRDTVARLLDPEFSMHQPHGLDYGSTFHGAEGFFRFLDIFGPAYDIEILENTGCFFAPDDPDEIILEFHFKGVARSTAAPFDTSQLEKWCFRDCRLLFVKPHWFELPRPIDAVVTAAAPLIPSDQPV